MVQKEKRNRGILIVEKNVHFIFFPLKVFFFLLLYSLLVTVYSGVVLSAEKK